jgi:outer membrane protein OmpA-like peptidoglycan-associated protein
MERQAAADRAAAQARAQAEAEAARNAGAARRASAEQARHQAELAAAREAQLTAEQNTLEAREAAAKAEAERVRRAAETLRNQLLEQLGRVLETRDTPRGLVVSMAGVLFNTGKYDLKGDAREKLSRLSGILAVHPGLRLEVEGHTDSTGTLAANQTLSERRAQAVAAYLIEQGVPGGSVTSRGLGPSLPIAGNDTAEGRQKNRRVEIIVSGEVIGKSIEGVIATDN